MIICVILTHIDADEYPKNRGVIMERDYSTKIHGVKIKNIARVCISICAVLLIVTYIGIFQVDKSYQGLVQTTNNCVEGQKCAVSLEHSSDYLTDEVRMYVMGLDAEHMYLYFEEIDSKNREMMVQRLEEIYGETDAEAVKQLKEALRESKALEELEVHAMCLTSYRLNLNKSDLPGAVADWEMTQEELEMTDKELRDAAYELVYGSEYLESKTRIKRSTADTFDILTENMEGRQKESGEKLEKTLAAQRVYTFLMIVLVGVVFWLIGILIVYPVTEHVRSIQSNKPWKDIGGYEMRYLANIYNRLYAKNEIYREELQYKAEHDALTGICNREVFEQRKERLRGRDVSIALMLVDVDEFKSVNDSLGHEVGDEALCRIANILKDIGMGDRYCVARIGGDEFAIILINTTETDFPRIQAEVDRINNEICRGDEKLPPLSVSAGIAFSRNGYTNELFHQADQALYHTKQNGRRGCSQYDRCMG